MTDETHLSEVIRNLLQALLFNQMQKHIPDDERVGILDGAYWIGYTPAGQTYVGVDHELPVFNRRLGSDGSQQIMLGLHGGVLVTTRIAGHTSAGTWTEGMFEEQAPITPPPDDPA